MRSSARAPEQENAEDDIDGRADVYALGCVLFEILTGEQLHCREDTAPPETRPSLRAPTHDIPPELDVLCVHATAPDRDARVSTPRELGERVGVAAAPARVVIVKSPRAWRRVRCAG